MRFVLFCVLSLAVQSLNLRPVLGVLSQPIEGNGTNKTSYIAASYVKFLEAAGAQVVPVRFDASNAELDTMMKVLYNDQ